ncbi:MAG: hypothetical protein KJN80_02580, partial [Deltaproteobacteria bacterium]|nr:hypothetical protein [Deltaproteobacteria bacterium]
MVQRFTPSPVAIFNKFLQYTTAAPYILPSIHKGRDGHRLRGSASTGATSNLIPARELSYFS